MTVNVLSNDQLLARQIELEQTYSDKNTIPYIRQLIGDNADINANAAELIKSLADWQPSEEPSQLDIVVPVLRKIDVREAVYSAIAYIMHKDGQVCTIQEVISTQLGKFDELPQMHDKLYACTFIVACAAKFKWIHENIRAGYQTLLRSEFRFNDEILNHIKKQGYVLPSIVPLKPITNNYKSGYQTFEKSVLLGGKGHDEFICLSHINRVNSVPFQYENRLRQIIEPTFSEEREVKKDGRWETDEDIEKRRETFKKLHTSLPERIDPIQEVSNIFYLAHGVCTRGRTHVNAYEYNYQGTKFLKGMIDLAEMEMIEPEWD